MTIADSTVLVTGANRGIGQALVEEALRRGARRGYAGTRQPLAHSDGRVTPLTLEVTNRARVQAAVARGQAPQFLANKPGLAMYYAVADRAAPGSDLARNPSGRT